MGVLGDVRHAVRTIRRMPVLAAVVVSSLGVGIGVNTTVFSWIQGLVLTPLPGVPDGAALRTVQPVTATGDVEGVSWEEYEDLRTGLTSFRDLIAAQMVPINVGEVGRTERAYGMLVSENYFRALGQSPAAGRFFSPGEGERIGGAPVAVISWGYWTSHYDRATGAVGSTIRINNQALTIVGVASAPFQGTITMIAIDLWVPATMTPVLFAGSTQLSQRGSREFAVMGHLAGSTTPAAAQHELEETMARLARLYPASNAGLTGQVLSFTNQPRGPQRFLVRALTVLQGIMVLLLLAVCGNAANLILARASARRREIAVRLVLGSGGWRVGRLMLVEGLLLGLAGAVVGAALAVWGTQAIRAVPMIGAFPIRFQTSVDVAGLVVAILLGVCCGVVFGTVPAVQLVRVNPADVLRSGTATGPRSRLRPLLMGGEAALATGILVAGGLFLQAFRQSRDADPGFRRDGVLLAAYDLTGEPTDSASVRVFTGTLLDRLRALPGVQAAAIALAVPLDIHGLPRRGFVVEGRARPDDQRDEAVANVVTPGYFATMGIPFVAGKDLADFNNRTAGPEVVVNQAFVDQYLDGREPLGRTLESGERAYVIAGVVRTTVSDAFGEPPAAAVYYSYRDGPPARGEIHVRTAPGSETAITAGIRRVVRDLNPMLPVYDVRTLGEHVEKNLFIQRIPARMFTVLGPLMLALAAIGIYAVVSYAVAQRTAEIGIRLALGATPTRVVGRMIAESMHVILFGTAAGTILAWGIGTGMMGGAGVPPGVLFGAPALLLAVALLSCWVPARKAAGVGALAALRTD